MTGTVLTRKEKVALLQEYHEPVFQALGIENPWFDSKAKNTKPPGPIGEVGFFESQLKEGNDIYFELNDFYQKIIDNKRTLYKLKGNLHFQSEPEKYKYVDNTPAGAQYYIATEHFTIVTIPERNLMKEALEKIERGDESIDQLTSRDWACIYLKVPESNHPWLDELIIKSKEI